MLKRCVFAMMCMLAVLAINAHGAGIPQLINYQGVLLDGEGDPVTGTRSVEFLLYDVETEGIALWAETQEVDVSDGLFNVLLGSVEPIPFTMFDSCEVYLALKVADDDEMEPRKRLVSVGYAFRANRADSLGSSSASDYIQTVNQVPPADGNVDLVQGANVTITPNAEANTITIAAAGGTGGDNLGDHTATQNIKLNGNWISNDGLDEGIIIDDHGQVGIGYAPSSPYLLDVNGVIRATSSLYATVIKVGSASSSFSVGDIVADHDVVADDELIAGENVTARSGYIRTGFPSYSGYGAGDIVADDDLIADDYVVGDRMRSYGQLYVNGKGFINTDETSSSFGLYVGGSAYCTGSWQSSDFRFKKDITDLSPLSEKIMGLRGVSYRWKADEFEDKGFDDDLHFGLIAQEVETVFPELVKTDDNGDKAVDYIGLIPVLIEAYKEQQQMIEDLQTTVNQLRN